MQIVSKRLKLKKGLSLTLEAALDKIRKGGGLMPPFAGVLKDDEQQAILAFVHSAAKVADTKAKNETDTATKIMYLNATGYITWKDIICGRIFYFTGLNSAT